MRFVRLVLAVSQAACYDPTFEPPDEAVERGPPGGGAPGIGDPGITCPLDYQPSDTGSCYRVELTEATWVAAERDCEDDVGAAIPHLLVLDAAGEDLAVEQLLSDDQWLGLRFSAGSWGWISTGSLASPNWEPDEPSGEGPCGELKKDSGKWDDESCDSSDELRPYVCEYDGMSPAGL